MSQTYPADLSYRLGSVLFSLVGVIGLVVAVTHHQTQSIPALAVPFLVFLAAVLLTNTFTLSVDESGLHQRSLLGRKEAAWGQVTRVDEGRAWSIHGADGKELVWLHMLPLRAQQAVAEEAIRRAGLRPTDAKLEFPLLKQWVA